MPDLRDGETAEVQGSARLPYILKNIGGVYSCSCPAWRNQSLPIDQRTCKHLRAFRGEEAESVRLGQSFTRAPTAVTATSKSTAPPLLLAETWSAEADPTGWWLSEKLDGVRAYWNGRQFVSRQGNPFHAPAWFTSGLPAVPLDGELWLGRKQFQRTVSIVRRQDGSDLWRELIYVVIDAPAAAGGFEARLDELRAILAENWAPYTRLLDQERCRGAVHLMAQLECVTQLGGEGLMLREPDSKYETGRSTTLQKLKRFVDAEARVIEHLPGRGRHRGRLGALLVALSDGTSFSVGTGFSDAQREAPPPVGSQITFRYQELTDGGVPRFPSFVCVRHD